MDQILAKVGEAAANKRRHEEKNIQARIKEITSRRALGKAFSIFFLTCGRPQRYLFFGAVFYVEIIG